MSLAVPLLLCVLSPQRVPAADDLAAALVSHLSADQDPQRAARALAALGADAIPALVDALVHDRVDDDGGSLRLSDTHEETVLAALALVPVGRVRDHVRELMDAEPDWPTGRTVARVLAEAGSGADLRTIAAACAVAVETPTLGLERRAVWSASLGRLLERRPETQAYVSALFHELHPSLKVPTLRAMRAHMGSRALALVEEWLGSDPSLDPILLAEIGRIAREEEPPFRRELVERVRGYLSSSQPSLVMEAALAAGELEDREAVPVLIELLEHSQVQVRRCAHTSLKRLSAKRIRLYRVEWEAWYDAEWTWWRDEAPALRADLTGLDPARAAAAINAMSRRRLFRHELVTDLVHALDRTEPELVRMAIAALASLGSAGAVPGLVTILDDPDPETAEAGWRALKRITGLDHPIDSESWRELGA